jgi:hypothetical protein
MWTVAVCETLLEFYKNELFINQFYSHKVFFNSFQKWYKAMLQ